MVRKGSKRSTILKVDTNSDTRLTHLRTPLPNQVDFLEKHNNIEQMEVAELQPAQKHTMEITIRWFLKKTVKNGDE